MTTSLTIHQIDSDLVQALQQEASRRGLDLDSLIRQTLAVHLGKAAPAGIRHRRNLRRFSGTWSEEQFQEFQRNSAVFEEIDEELWR
jgi:hypothetical protein